MYGGWVDRGTCMVDGWIGGHIWWMGGWGTFMVDGWMGDIGSGWGILVVDGWMGGY